MISRFNCRAALKEKPAIRLRHFGTVPFLSRLGKTNIFNENTRAGLAGSESVDVNIDLRRPRPERRSPKRRQFRNSERLR